MRIYAVVALFLSFLFTEVASAQTPAPVRLYTLSSLTSANLSSTHSLLIDQTSLAAARSITLATLGQYLNLTPTSTLLTGTLSSTNIIGLGGIVSPTISITTGTIGTLSVTSLQLPTSTAGYVLLGNAGAGVSSTNVLTLGGLYLNGTLTGTGGVISPTISGTNWNFNGASITVGGLTANSTITSTGGVVSATFRATGMTAGSVFFSGASGLVSQDNSNLFWDNTNKRLGIGTNSPANDFHVNSTGRTFFRVSTTVSGTGDACLVLSNDSNAGLFAFVGSSVKPGTLLGANRANTVMLSSESTYPLYIGSQGAGHVGISTSNNERMRVTETGDVGIGTTAPVAKLDVRGSTAFQLRAMSASGNITSTDTILTLTGGITATLPTAVSTTGREVIIKNIDATTSTVNTTSGQTVDGATTTAITSTGVLRVISNGANWITW